MNIHHKINYIEMPSSNIEATKTFFSRVFGWSFIDYGPDYCSFNEEGIDGGFYASNKLMSAVNGSALIVIYSKDLEQTQHQVTVAGGLILKPIFSFPGGRRFHFADPNGSEYAVWSE